MNAGWSSRCNGSLHEMFFNVVWQVRWLLVDADFNGIVIYCHDEPKSDGILFIKHTA